MLITFATPVLSPVGHALGARDWGTGKPRKIFDGRPQVDRAGCGAANGSSFEGISVEYKSFPSIPLGAQVPVDLLPLATGFLFL